MWSWWSNRLVGRIIWFGLPWSCCSVWQALGVDETAELVLISFHQSNGLLPRYFSLQQPNAEGHYASWDAVKLSLTWRYPIKLVVNLSWSCQGALSLGFIVTLSQFSKRWQEDSMTKPEVHNAMICCKIKSCTSDQPWTHQFIVLNIEYFPITLIKMPCCLHFSRFVRRQFFPWAAHCAIEMIPNTSCYIY
jgi:hypothetical protein